MLTDEEIDSLVQRIVRRMHPDRVILFGSYAKGTATLRSDVDLLVVKQTDLPITRRADDLAPILSSELFPVDVHVYTPEEVEQYGKKRHSFMHSVLASGRVVFERGG